MSHCSTPGRPAEAASPNVHQPGKRIPDDQSAHFDVGATRARRTGAFIPGKTK